MIQQLESLMESVEVAWQRHGRAPEAFGAIAATALEHAQLHTSLTFTSLIDALARRCDYPEQQDTHAVFGEPPVTLLCGDGFHLDVYFWLEPSTSIHNHIFSGAFTVLEGQSLHVVYDFDVRASFDEETILIGAGEVREVELLQRGAVRKITRGSALTHQVVHLSRPTVSLVLRTSRPSKKLKSYTFLMPSLGSSGPDRLSAGARRQLAVARMLCRLPDEALEAKLAVMLTHAQRPLQRLWLLRTAFFETRDRSLVQRLVGGLDAPWGAALLDAFSQAEEDPTRWTRWRASEHRLFTALASATRDRAVIEAVIEQFDPSRPAKESVLAWVRSLSAEGLYLAPTEHHERVLQALIEGLGVSGAALALARSFGLDALPPQLEGQLSQFIAAFKSFLPLRIFLEGI